MKALGLGVPAAWREHVLADERIQAMSRAGAAVESHLAVSTATASAAKDRSTSSDIGVKVFTGGRVPGGLRKLALRHCSNLTNKRIRAILRSCVGLELLNISENYQLTLELFQGPWACSRLRDLDITGLNIETTPQDLGVIDDDPRTYNSVRRAQYREELVESSRFPLVIDPYPQEGDSDDDVKDVRCYTPRRRAILRQFYSKLGQLDQLGVLKMNDCRFRVRVKDGLELVLLGLQQNLVKWMLNLHDIQMGNSELEFFGKHFGYGHDFTVPKDDDQESRKRKAQLEQLLLCKKAVRLVRCELLDWARRQGCYLKLEDSIYG
ncbi:hypothetical protein EC968_001159 [Mortierella alpina]|nr:hypothetical protein EC968_001159 [Mortierella alpina]